MTSSSSTTCTLYGYPGMQLLDAQGGDIPTTVVRGGLGGGAPAAANAAGLAGDPGGGADGGVRHAVRGRAGGQRDLLPHLGHRRDHPAQRHRAGRGDPGHPPCDNGTVHVSPVYAAG